MKQISDTHSNKVKDFNQSISYNAKAFFMKIKIKGNLSFKTPQIFYKKLKTLLEKTLIKIQTKIL